MKTNYISALEQTVSSIGFGCASLGSRISPSEGMSAVRRALSLGVTWFDVAPPYGDGQAEHWLGQALGAQRMDVVICTKVGIQRPQISGMKRLIKPVARAAVKAFPGIRSAVSKARSTGARPPLLPQDIERSVTESLRQLNTDYIDVLALHEPPADEPMAPEIQEALLSLVSKGLVRALSVAGDQASVTAALSSPTYQLVQFPDTPRLQAANTIKRLQIDPTSKTMVTHGVFGSGVLSDLTSLPESQAAKLQRVAATNGLVLPSGAPDLPALLLATALSSNPDGVVIMSMFSESHARRNVEIASRSCAPELSEQVHQALA